MADTTASENLNAAAAILLADAPSEAIAIRFRSDAESYDVTYGELRSRVRQVAGRLRSLGADEEQRVLVILPDSPEFVYAFLGAIWAGVVPVLVNSFLRPEAYRAFLEETRARVVFTGEALAAELADTGRKFLTVGAKRSGSFWDGLESLDPMSEPYPTHRDDPAFWLYSSGTTGRPKGVVHSQKDISHAVATYGRHILDVSPSDVSYATSKMFFAYGLGGGLYFPLSAGASVVLGADAFVPARTWKYLAAERPTLLFAVPSVYRALLDNAPPDANESLSRVRRCLSAGEGLPETIFHEWKNRFGLEIVDGIGSTEMVHIYLSNSPGDCVPGTLGRAVPGYEVKVVDEGGQPAPAGEPGMMLVRGGSAAAGYWQRGEASRAAFRGDWFVSGDQAVENPDGTYSVLGRADDMLKISGQWVSPMEVENVIAAVAGVRECAVVSRKSQTGLLELVACIVAHEGHGESVGIAVETFCAERLPRYKRPKLVHLSSEPLPRTATGKVQRFKVRELFISVS